MVLAIECNGKDILTIEGLEQGGKLHPIQQAFINENALQCGMCTPGMIMAAKALLDQNKNPTYAEMQEGMSATWCRCGAYVQIFRAVTSAGKAMGA